MDYGLIQVNALGTLAKLAANGADSDLQIQIRTPIPAAGPAGLLQKAGEGGRLPCGVTPGRSRSAETMVGAAEGQQSVVPPLGCDVVVHNPEVPYFAGISIHAR